MASRIASLLVLLGALPATAEPYVAYVGGVPVHSGSPASRIMVRDLDQPSDPLNVSAGLHSARAPAWSPAGRLAFEAIDGSSSDIYVCRPDGSERANITHTPDEWESAPAFVDEGHLVCLSGPDRTVLVLVDVATRQRRILSEMTRFHGTPVVSPSRDIVIVFASERLGGPGDLVLVPVDGGPVRTLTAASALYSTPCYSPDGGAVYACFDGCDIGGTARGLARFPLDGSTPDLVAELGYPFSAVSVSPDGSRVAYTTSTAFHDTWISLAHADGSGAARLDVSGFHIIAWPSFSPDARWLAFEGVHAASYSVNVVDLASGAVTRITPEGDTGVRPVFSR